MGGVWYTAHMKKVSQNMQRFGLLAGIALFVAIAVFGVVYVIWYDLNIGFYAPAHPDFKGYTPQAQLNGSSVKTTKLTRYKEYGLDDWWFDYAIEYASGVTVYERNSGTYPDTVASCSFLSSSHGNYSDECSEHAIRNGGRYMVRTDTYKGKLFSDQVEALIDNTKIYVSIPADQRTIYAQYPGWQAFFDSLTPLDVSNMPYNIETHHQGGA